MIRQKIIKIAAKFKNKSDLSNFITELITNNPWFCVESQDFYFTIAGKSLLWEDIEFAQSKLKKKSKSTHIRELPRH